MIATAARARLAATPLDGGLDLSVIIVTYNVRDLLRHCLVTLLASEGDFTYEVAVVDNRSTDGSVAMVESEFPGVRVIASQVNGGFAYGNNLGLAHAGGRFVLLLNPDTELPADALSRMLAYLDARPWAGAAGPKLVRADGTLDLACRRSFPSPEVSFYRMLGLSKAFPHSRRFARYNLTYLDPDQPAEVDSVVGAFMLIRRDCLATVGLLDETFFMYGEDLDLAYRLKQAGWRVLYNPDVVVLHHKGESSRQARFRTTYEFYRAMYVFYRKHYWGERNSALNALVTGAILVRGGLALAELALAKAVSR
ncbi:MAG: glycosyltransferase family 2 protein [Chloroflexi bacterium]|nr:glycosyltransferase family 2 protein [Chloroflexota bacterium]MCL5108171.1 glycosyltransferase family 2 protein [Chloroflexota bacterium]